MRLIDADTAIEVLNEQIEQCNKALGSFDISLKDEYAAKVERASLEAYKEQLENIPSAQPERKTGHWVETGDEPYDEWECDVCGFTIDGSGCIDPEEYRDVYKFCPNCGADMRGDKHEVD